MNTNTISASQLTKMFLGGANNLEAKKEWINELNVFPVPDGDTGTNMSMTIMSAAKEVGAVEDVNMASVAKAISSGSLRGARGNSGVILSQLLRGFTKVIANSEEIDIVSLSEGMQKAVETAYKAVMKPKEGTILTVARAAADKAVDLVGEIDCMETYLEEIIKEAEITLAKTPDMLPVLKQAGVVDSGGQGLVEVLKGAFDVYMGKEVDYSAVNVSKPSEGASMAPIQEENIKYGYCTEFIIVQEKALTEKEENSLKAYLESIGDSIVVVADEEITKIHVHTNDPGLALQKALTFGALSRIKIDNMREENQERMQNSVQQQSVEEPRKDMGFISVSVGDGLSEIFKGLGVDYLIEGGQTMNPSTEDMLNAIAKVNADHVFILPNNKNIILAANQAAELCEDKKIIVIPTKTIPQGIVAMINYMPEMTPDENQEAMTNELDSVKTGQVTYAVRDTVIDDIEIKEHDFMGIGDQGILSAGKDMQSVIMEMVEKMVDEDSSIISIYYGSDVDEDEANELSKQLEEKFSDCELEVYSGGQPIYYYFISVE